MIMEYVVFTDSSSYSTVTAACSLLKACYVFLSVCVVGVPAAAAAG